jgi:hypothetical protein
VSEAYRVLVKHLDEASNPSTHSPHSHPFFNSHHGSEHSFSDDEYDDEYYDEYDDSDDEVAFYLSVFFSLFSINKFTGLMHIFRYIFEDIIKSRYEYLNRNSR